MTVLQSVTWQSGISVSKMKRKHDEAQCKEKDVNNFGTKRQKTIAEVTDRLKRDLQQKLSIFTNPQQKQDATQAETSVKHCFDKAEIKVCLNANSDCNIDLKAENNNNVTKERSTKYSEKVESDSEKSQKVECAGKRTEKVASHKFSFKREAECDDKKSSTDSQKSKKDREKTQSQGKQEPKKKKEIPKQFKINSPVGFQNWIQNIQNFMVTYCSLYYFRNKRIQADTVASY